MVAFSRSTNLCGVLGGGSLLSGCGCHAELGDVWAMSCAPRVLRDVDALLRLDLRHDCGSHTVSCSDLKTRAMLFHVA